MKYLAINTAVKTEILLSTGDDCANKNSLDFDASLNVSANNEIANVSGNNVNIQIINGDYYFSSAEKSATGTRLLYNIDQMLNMAAITLNDLDFIACVVGPGSFTGIRVGVSAMRALAYALNKRIIPVTYFDVCAYNSTAPFTVAIDGGCGVCYVQSYFKSSEPINAKSALVNPNLIFTAKSGSSNPNNAAISGTSNPNNAAISGCNSLDSVDNAAVVTESKCNTYPTCIKNDDLRLYSCGDIVADSYFNDAVTRTLPSGHLPLKVAVERAASQNEFISYKALQPLYLRRSQPEREQGEL